MLDITINMYKKEEYKTVALIVAAGIGSRCDTPIPKQYIKLKDEAVLFYVIKKFLANQNIDCVKVVINKEHENFYRDLVSSIIDTRLLNPIYGGKDRQESVKLGLESLQADYVIIHDACRPFVSNALIEKLIKLVSCNNQSIGIVPAIEIEDTVSLVSNNVIESTMQRTKLRAIQTPQIFNFKELLLCHTSTQELFTDDSSLVKAQKKHVEVIQGEKSNFKLTTKEDINRAKFLFSEPRFRVGSGYDIHRFKKTKNKCFIKICGVEIEYDMKVEAHSDGDVALHAIVDAILGALGCGDIGDYFPPSSPEWKNCDSLHFLNFAIKKAKEKGYVISNLDITIICERPRISPYKTQMKAILSKTLEINDELVNVKATTAEKLGSIGREEGIAAYATVLLCNIIV